MDAYINSPEWIDRIQALAHRTGAKLSVLECQISEKALKKRLAERGLKRDQVKLTPEGWEAFKKADKIGAKNPLPHLVINVEEGVEQAVAQAIDFIRP